MKKAGSKLLGIAITASMAASLLTGCSGSKTTSSSSADETATTVTEAATTSETTEESTQASGEPTVIRWGTHYVQGLDPNYVDEVTGEYVMAESERQASLAALDAVKEQLNVDIEFVQYSQDTRNELMTSVLAGSPVCDLAVIWGGAEGTILAQNVLQQLDNYTDVFSDDDTSWMLYDQLYGHYYLLTSIQRFYQRWPLIFNISMLEKVDALKDENGDTTLPTDLFISGDWTWSTFEDYLSKVQAYYSNVTAPDGAVNSTVEAYETDHRFAGLSAMYAAGGAIYGPDGLSVDSEGSVLGTQYIADLMDAGLLVDCGTYDDQYTPQWTTGASDFGRGATVFTDCPDWMIAGCASSAADRGESIGMVPWPREDSLGVDDEAYQQVITLGDSVGVLKGVDDETTRLALETFALYYKTYYQTLGGVDSISDYKDTMAASQAAALGLDVYNEDYGEDLLTCFTYITNHLSPDYADLLGMRVTWDDIFGKGLYGVDGTASYDVAIEANKSEFDTVVSDMQSILSSDEVRDNQGPSITASTIVIAKGEGNEDTDWSSYFTANDAVDGDLDMTTATYEISSTDLDFNTPGTYSDAVNCTIADASGNESSKKAAVVIYDPDNTEKPVITQAETLPAVATDTDTSTIDWKQYATAVDADGIDISSSVFADLSELDATTPGDYTVVLTFTDYAGNSDSIDVTVTVGNAEE